MRNHILFVLLSCLLPAIVRAEKGNGEMLYVRHLDSLVTVIPRNDVSEYGLHAKRFTATLVNGETVRLDDVAEVTEATPLDLPSFSSYKFNNKYNPQVFTDVIAADPSADTLTLSVAGIGKWLTASFQTADGSTRVEVNGKPQRSKRTRQSFASPVTYQLTNPEWQMILLRKQNDGTYKKVDEVFVREQTVQVIFTTDHSTNDYTVPRIDITLLDAEGGTPTGNWSETNWIGMQGKDTYMPALIEINGGDAFPDMPATPVQVKGRGNTSWKNSSQSKNPYRLKFTSKQKPLGMTAGKSWVLLSNKQKGSMTTNAIGMKLAALFGCAGANHIVPVELYVNGSYRGSYNLTEKVGFSNNSIDLIDESLAAMIEMDIYGESNGIIPDKNNAYSVACKVKEPDLDDDYYIHGGKLSQKDILDDYYHLMNVLKKGTDAYTNLVNTDAMVRYLSANEAMYNLELCFPKSVFVYSEDVTNRVEAGKKDSTPWTFGPVWDCDWCFGYTYDKQYYVDCVDADYFEDLILHSRGNLFWNDLRHNSVEVDSLYYRLWTDIINSGGIAEMKDFCDEYYRFAEKSLLHNNDSEADEKDDCDYLSITLNSKNWIETRLNHIYAGLTPYPLTSDDKEDNTPISLPEETNSKSSATGRRNVTYDLSGRAVRPGQNRRGVYIQNGRKFVK